MTNQTAPCRRRRLVGLASLTAGMLALSASYLPAVTICRDGASGARGIPEALNPAGAFDYTQAPFAFQSTTIRTMPGGRYFDEDPEGASFEIETLQVFLKLRHPRITDLTIWLRHVVINEDGTEDVVTIPLMSNNGCFEEDDQGDFAGYPSGSFFNQDVGIVFDDAAQASILFACDRSIPGISGRYRPFPNIIPSDLDPDTEEGAGLDAFSGRNVLDGQWFLIIADGGNSGETAALVEWCMIVNDRNSGDVAPREETVTIARAQSGNGVVTISDQVGSALTLLGYLSLDERLLERRETNLSVFLGQDTPDVTGLLPGSGLPVSIFFNRDFYENLRRSSGLEFSLLDAAPASSKGDGKLTVADWVQITRYAAGEGFDEPEPSAGPLALSDRQVWADNVTLEPGETVRVPIHLRSRSVEHEIGFGLEFDNERLEFLAVEPGECIPSNATFQIVNASNANESGLIGLQVGLLPDQTFLCDFQARAPAVGNAAGNEIPFLTFDNSGTAPASVLYNLSTSINSIDFSDPQNPIVVVDVFVTNPIDDPIVDYEFDLVYTDKRLSPREGEITYGGFAGSSEVLSAGQFDRSILRVGGVDAGASFFGGLLVTIPFDVIVEQTIDEDGLIVSSTESPSVVLAKSERTTINASIVGNDSPLTRARYNSTATDPIETRARIRLLDLAGNDCTDDFTTGTQRTIDVVVENNVQAVTAYDLVLRYDPRFLDFIRAARVPDSGFGSDPEAETQAAQAGVEERVFLESLDPNSTFLNGRLARLVFETEDDVEGSSIDLVAVAGPRLVSGETAIPTDLVGDYTFGCSKKAVLDVADATAGEADEKNTFIRPTPPPTLSNTVSGLRLEGSDVIMDVAVEFSNNAETITSYDLLLTFDGAALEFVSAEDGGDGFGAEPDVSDVVYTRANFVTHRLSAENASSTLAAGALANLRFRVIGDEIGAPSVFLTKLEPYAEKTTIAYLVLRGRENAEPAVTDLRFVPEPQFFNAPAVRNVAGVPVYTSFSDSSVTLVDNALGSPILRVEDTILCSGEEGTIDVVLDSVGLEHAAGFVLEFDSSALELVSLTRGPSVPTDGFFFTYPSSLNVDEINDRGGFSALVSNVPGLDFEPGKRVLVRMRFQSLVPTTEVATTQITLSELVYRLDHEFPDDDGTTIETVNALGTPIVTLNQPGVITIAGDACLYELVDSDGDATGNFSAAGGEGTFSVTAGPECPWRAVPNEPWVEVVAGGSGIGNGVVTINVAPNPSCQPRSALIEVACSVYTVTQAGCGVSVEPGNFVVDGDGGSREFTITTSGPLCEWRVRSLSPWIIISSTSFGTGAGTVSFTVQPNVGADRIGTIEINLTDQAECGQPLIVTVDQITCRYDVEPLLVNVGCEGDEEVCITVTPLNDCPWSASTTADWITVPSGSRTGAGQVCVVVAPNPSPEARNAIVRVAGNDVQIVQAGGNAVCYEFAAGSSTQGWEFHAPVAAFTAPIGQHTPNGLELRTTNNTNTFGEWRSSAHGFCADIEGGQIRADLTVSSDVPQADTPVFRVRQSTLDFSQTDVFVVTSAGAAGLAPTSGGKQYTQLFSLPQGVSEFRSFFDVLSFDPTDAVPEATVALQRICLTLLDEGDVRSLSPVRQVSLADAANASEWVPVASGVTPDPRFERPFDSSPERPDGNKRGLLVTSGFPSGGPAPAVVGFWTWDSGVTLQGGKGYRVRFRVSAIPGTTPSSQKRLIPTFRVRVNDSSFQLSAYRNLESIDDNSPVPNFTESRTYGIWFVAPPEVNGNNLLLALDYIFGGVPESGVGSPLFDDPGISLVLENIIIESFDLVD